jgi:membrane associated rhomboid family serine protease
VFIPLYDRNPRVLIAWPWVTWGLILGCAAIFAVQLSLGPRGQEHLVYGLGLIPATLIGDVQLHPDLRLAPPPVTLVTYMFLHGGLLHLGGNMLFLWVFGDNIEDAMGHRRFVFFFVLGGALAGLAQALVEPGARVPIIGASGAIAAVLGAYLVLHPRAKILVPIVIFPVYLPAVLPLLFWIAFQVFAAMSGGAGNVAWWAHIGGFVAGAILIVPLRHNSLPLWGVSKLPGGLRLRKAWQRKNPDETRDRTP